MAVLVSQLISRARSLMNDELGDHFVADDGSDQVDGVNLRFKAVNQNLVDTADGAPADPVMLVNGTPVTATVDNATGIFTAASAPAAGSLVSLEYYFVLILDDTWLTFARLGAEFVGVSPDFTAPTDDSHVPPLLELAVEHCMAGLGAGKMANLSSWYYAANAGDKSFNKDAIAAKFSKIAADEQAAALKARDDVYTRQGQRNAPAYRIGARIPFPSWAPRR